MLPKTIKFLKLVLQIVGCYFGGKLLGRMEVQSNLAAGVNGFTIAK
ncbi:hypothetical protein FHS68_002820 [Dyadobacter arcticus]|uniref:Uncharacterized protein n=1 Tax=Dyadobacter arcticus TaxID=1078754 RepID=A0ABX0UMG6_9BACT|nr:hypothetical protein [Dyadobacter arcticus]